MEREDFLLQLEIRRYNMLCNLILEKKEIMKHLKRKRLQLTRKYDCNHNDTEQQKLKSTIKQFNCKKNKIEKAIYFDPNTFCD